MNHEEPYWDELGVAWRTIEPDIERALPDLQVRLHRQSLAIAAALGLGVPLCIGGIALGTFTIWRGSATHTWNFVTRGIAIALISVVLFHALASLLPFRKRPDAQNLSAMLDLVTARLRRTLFLLRAAISACGIAAAFGIAGSIIRERAGSSPHLSPVVDLILIGLIAVLFSLCARTVSTMARKFDYLRRAFGTGE